MRNLHVSETLGWSEKFASVKGKPEGEESFIIKSIKRELRTRTPKTKRTSTCLAYTIMNQYTRQRGCEAMAKLALVQVLNKMIPAKLSGKIVTVQKTTSFFKQGLHIFSFHEEDVEPLSKKSLLSGKVFTYQKLIC